MSDEAGEREHLVRLADVLKSRLMRSVDALAHRKMVRGAVRAVTDKPMRDRIKRHARHVVLAVGVALVMIATAVTIKRIARRAT